MHKIILICVLFIRFGGCNQDVVTPGLPITPHGYPYISEFSQARYEGVRNSWAEFADSFGLPAALPPIDSVNMIPVGYFPSVNIFYTHQDTITEAGAEARFLGVVDRWPLLFNSSSSELVRNSVSYNPTLPGYEFFYEKKFNGAHNPTGMNAIRVSVRLDGTAFIQTTCAPTVLIPPVVNISPGQALRAVEGKMLTYYDWVGRKTDTISARTVKSSQLTIALIPRYRDPGYQDYIALRSVEYRNCWQLTTRVFQVYVDAITGEDVDYAQQYIIF